MSLWRDRVVPFLVEKACRSTTILEERRRWVPRARGEVLELGIGSGLNLAHYAPGRVDRITGVDPSAPLLARAAARIADAPAPVELVEAHAEALPFAAAAFDSAVVTYSLCSVDDPARVLAEVRRVLRPGGELVFIEHGLAPDPRTRRWQRRLTPAWRRIAGGCRFDRDPPALLAAAGFELAELIVGSSEEARSMTFTYQGAARPA